MSIIKITAGYYRQEFNENGKCIAREFIASDQCDYENEQGDTVEPVNHLYEPFFTDAPIDDQTRQELKHVLNYIFEFESEDYAEKLKEIFPEDVDYISECFAEGNWESLDKYIWNGTREIHHVYAEATKINNKLFNEDD